MTESLRRAFSQCVQGGAACAEAPFSQGASFDFSSYLVLPGLADVHVHLREPGFSYKETVKTGTLAAARGGFTSVCSMPNVFPPPDCLENLAAQSGIISRDARVNVFPVGAITLGRGGSRLADLERLAPHVVAFSDDGSGVDSGELMLEAMEKCACLGKIIAAHCELSSLSSGGCVHDGEYARANALPGISSESEWKALERDLGLVKKTGCAYHMCHVSTAESVALLRRAKAAGLDVTCETAPHYLLLSDSFLMDDGRWKMNPPLRSERDRRAVLEGLLDGTIDMIATDHAPHTPEEKSRGLAGSLMGISGLECALPLLYTALVVPGIISLARLTELMSTNPRRRFSLPDPVQGGEFILFDPDRQGLVAPEEFLSMGKATPFEGWHVRGRCIMTLCRGGIVYKEDNI